MENKFDAKQISDLQYIKGIGPNRAKALIKDGIKTSIDLLYYFPRAYVDRNAVANVRALKIKLKQEENIFFNDNFDTHSFLKDEVTLVLRVDDKIERKLRRNKRLLQLKMEDDTGIVWINFWNYIDYFNKQYSIGDKLIVSGRPEIDAYDKITFTHPEIQKFDIEEEKIFQESGILPIYTLKQSMKSAKITMKILRNAIRYIIEKEFNNINESLPENLLSKFNFPQKNYAIKLLHSPEDPKQIDISMKRLKFEEAFYFELFLLSRKQTIKFQEKGIKINPKSKLAREMYDSLPFKLTKDQKKVLREMADDLQSGKPMNRLLQGDVGSGKTIVALLLMMILIDAGYQTVITTPTEILAEQHYHTIKNFINNDKIKIVQLVGGQKKSFRNEILETIRNGQANIIVGTHAVFENEIVYNNLGLVIIDEQHRFGVAQRAKLKELAQKSFKDESLSPHILVMSATPIPRTLSMTVYGDLDVSVIKEKPIGRKDIKTKIVFESQLNQVYDFIKKEIKKGYQAYIVYPLVEESEKLDYKAATVQFGKIQNEIFNEFKCGLLHGQMLWYEKETVMKDFLNKKYDILVATTVIEVGIDVPNATVMLIENAERFGLSQLHQLRGRIGRSDIQSYCFLATKDNFQYALKKNIDYNNERKAVIVRLKAMEQKNNGFDIAEIDLKLRGPGDFLGTRQAGLPSFKFIDIINDGEIITLSRKEAKRILNDDPQLRDEKNKIIRKEFINIYRSGKNYFGIA